MTEATKQQMDDLLKNVSFRLEGRPARIRQDAPNFSVFNYIQPNENCLSRMIADLLDPNEAHGQGDAYLRLFLEVLAHNKFPVPDDPRKIEATVRREHVTSDIESGQRRIDITISFADGRIIGIENKPKAADQPNQLTAYADQLSRHDPDQTWLLLYMTLDGKCASEGSMKAGEQQRLRESGNLALISYKNHIGPWLEKCAARAAPAHVRSYLAAFVKYVNGPLISGEQNIEQAIIVDCAMESLPAAIELIQSRVKIFSRLFEKANVDIAALLTTNQKLTGWTVDFPLDPDYRISFKRKPADAWVLAFEFVASDRRGGIGIFGVKHADIANQRCKISHESPGVSEMIGKHFPDACALQSHSGWFPLVWSSKDFILKDFDLSNNDLRDYSVCWDTNPRPWLDIKDGSFARRIVAAAAQLAGPLAEIMDSAPSANPSGQLSQTF